jgi:hypothetical protein
MPIKMTLSPDKPLTIADTCALADIVRACQGCQRVGWVDPDIRDGHELLTGTMRSIGDDSGNFLRADEDVRGTGVTVRVTMDSGLEHFMPIARMVALYHDSLLILNYRAHRVTAP